MSVPPPAHSPPSVASAARGAPSPINFALLRTLPLPPVDDWHDEGGRGRALIAGGGQRSPGALVLSATAALRAGAVRLRLAAAESMAALLGTTVPEAEIVALGETERGTIAPRAADSIVEQGNGSGSLLLGPGMDEDEAVGGVVERVLYKITRPVVILEGAAATYLRHNVTALHRLDGHAVVVPHIAELARIFGIDVQRVRAEPLECTRRAAAALRAVVALKSTETLIAAPDGTAFRYAGAPAGMNTAGAGDVLAGLVGGLAARGGRPLEAAVWSAYLHGAACGMLAQSRGPVGFLARELLDAVPAALQAAMTETR